LAEAWSPPGGFPSLTLPWIFFAAKPAQPPAPGVPFGMTRVW